MLPGDIDDEAPRRGLDIGHNLGPLIGLKPQAVERAVEDFL